MKYCRILLVVFTIVALQLIPKNSNAQIPVPDHVVIVVFENHEYHEIFGSTAAPYINSLFSDPKCALFEESYGLSHPSQPNYLQLYSGSNQGVTNNLLPAIFPFTTPNLGAALLANGRTFIGYSEGLPYVGSNVEVSGLYVRKHNPWVNWQGSGTNGVPSNLNQPFTAFPVDYNLLPTVSFVVPDLVNGMHDGTDPSRINIGDTWLQNNLGGYIQWAKTHNSLLIVTFDEDNGIAGQHILTFFIGEMVLAGTYSIGVTHYNVLRMLEDMYALPHSGAAATSSTIDYCWTTSALLQIKVIIQGFYIGAEKMNTLINGTICDTISVILHDSNSPFDSITSIKGVLDSSGYGDFIFPVAYSGFSYYIAVRHRNSLETWSALPVFLNPTSTGFDFTTSSAQAHGGNQFTFPDGKAAIYSGDVDQDGSIDHDDYLHLETAMQLFLVGYHREDLNGDKILETADLSLIENNSQLSLIVDQP